MQYTVSNKSVKSDKEYQTDLVLVKVHTKFGKK